MITLKDRRLFVLLAALLSLKLALIAMDGYPSVFMGDSSAYLYTALHGYIPHDRGFLYGWLLRPLAVWPHSLLFLVCVQAILSGLAAWLLAVNLTVLGASFRWAAIAGVICAIEPLQLISERYVLADTTALFLFAVLVTCVIWCWRTGSGFAVALAFITGVILIAIRISYLPLVMVNSFLLPFLWWWKRGWKWGATRRSLGFLLLWLCAGQVLLYSYQRLNAEVCGMARPAYLYADGFFLLSDVAPIVKETDLPPGALGQKIFRSVTIPLDQPIYREAQLFSPGGLAWAFGNQIPDEYTANDMARTTALRAMEHHPRAFLALAVQTWADYFNSPFLAIWLKQDEGGLRPPDGAFGAEMRKVFGIDPGPRGVNGPVWRWHRLAIPWCWLLVTLPLVLPAFLPAVNRPIRPVVAYLHFFLLLMFLPAVVVTQHAEPRYLIPVAWLTFLAAVPIVISRKKSGDREPAPVLPGCTDRHDRTPTGCST
jgi:hypothetical protein